MSSLWALPDFDDHEAVHLLTDRASGLRAIIAVHSTHLGPSAGGTRFWHYPNEEEALTDALRLSRGMSYKNALAGLPLGGGKAVILADQTATKTAAMLAAFARSIDQLGGRYVTAQDVGMSQSDMVEIRRHTRHVAGLPSATGGVGGDPGQHTALVVFLGIRAAVKRVLGKDNLNGLHIAIQGAGSVGSGVAFHAAAEGARLSIGDVDGAKANALAGQLDAAVVAPATIMAVEADVFSPCALGGILDEQSIASLQVPIVAGGANNQLATAGDGQRLQQRGILYAPDYVINAGGIINVGSEYLGEVDAAAVRAKVEQIPARLEQIWAESDSLATDPATTADTIARTMIGRG